MAINLQNLKILLSFLLLIFSLSPIYSQQKLGIIDAIKLSKEKNPMANVYKMNVDLQKADIQTAGLRPNIIFNQQSIFLVRQKYLDAIKTDQNLFISPYASQLWFQLTKQYQIGNKRQAKINVQTKEYEYTKTDVDAYLYATGYEAAQKWLDCWYAYIQLDIIKQAEENLDTLVQINRVRLKNQVITSNELTRTLILDEQYNILNLAGQQKLKSELRRLAFLTGFTDTIMVDFNNDYFYKLIPSNEINSLIGIALQNRPDLKSLRMLPDVSKANMELNKKLATPNPEFGLVFNPQNIQPYVGWYFQMPLPLFDRNQGNIQKSKVELAQSETKIAAFEMQTKAEVTAIYQEYEVHKSNSERYLEIEEKADLILKTVKYSYLRGGTTIVDYLLAQQNWFETQKGYYQALYNYRKSYLDLLFVTGLLNE